MLCCRTPLLRTVTAVPATFWVVQRRAASRVPCPDATDRPIRTCRGAIDHARSRRDARRRGQRSAEGSAHGFAGVVGDVVGRVEFRRDSGAAGSASGRTGPRPDPADGCTARACPADQDRKPNRPWDTLLGPVRRADPTAAASRQTRPPKCAASADRDSSRGARTLQLRFSRSVARRSSRSRR
jgi:hypothetical protein